MKNLKTFDTEPLVVLTRGNIVESYHYGACVITDFLGNIVFSQGDPELITYPRSSMKPLQILSFIENGGQDQYNLTPKEIAIMCASHSGTDEHVSVIKGIHTKVGLKLENLLCGTHWPFDKETTNLMKSRGEEPNAYRHNCSGKHSGMLAYAKHLKLPLDNYLDPTHPVQQRIIETVAEMCELEPEKMLIGIDGCSAPVFGIPLINFAKAMAKFVYSKNLSQNRAAACKKIVQSMIRNPEMVAGNGRLDTVLMQALDGKLISKSGAEGYQMMAILPDVLSAYPYGLGIAIKIIDGDQTHRALECFAVELLRFLGLIGTSENEPISNFGNKKLNNWRGIPIGYISAIINNKI